MLRGAAVVHAAASGAAGSLELRETRSPLLLQRYSAVPPKFGTGVSRGPRVFQVLPSSSSVMLDPSFPVRSLAVPCKNAHATWTIV